MLHKIKQHGMHFAVLCAGFLAASVIWGNSMAAVEARDAAAKVLAPSAPGKQVYSSGGAVLDISNASQGYVMLNDMWVHSPPLGAQANFNRIEKRDTM